MNRGFPDVYLPEIYISIPPFLLWGVFGLLVIMVLVLGAIISYHFRDYGFERIRAGFMGMVYYIVCGALLFASFTFITLYLDSL